MQKILFLTLMSMAFFIIEMPNDVMASQSDDDFTPADYIKSQAGNSAAGFDPADEMYIKADTDHYWKGRYSNGRIFSEYIANELAGDYDNLQNYAVGGTMSGVMTGVKDESDERSNWSEWLKGWGGVQQTERFVEDVDGQADPDGLYIIEVGGNDNYAIEDLGKERTAELSGDYTLEMIKNLVDNGAKYILLPNVYKDGHKDSNDIDDMRNKQVDENIKNYLADESTPDDVEIVYGDSDRLRENIEEQGYEKFGYKSMGFYMISDWAPAYGYGLVSEDNSDIFPTSAEEDDYDGYDNYSTDSEYYNPEAADWEPNDFYTYDEYHLTNRSQKHKATYLLNSDIESEDGTFQKVYNDEISPFAEAIDEGTIPAEYSKIYTFGASSIDSGRALEVTTDLVENRGIPQNSSYTVTPGDNLWNIAKENYSGALTNKRTMQYTENIYQVNQDQIQDPNLIYPNQTIILPTVNDSAE